MGGACSSIPDQTAAFDAAKDGIVVLSKVYNGNPVGTVDWWDKSWADNSSFEVGPVKLEKAAVIGAHASILKSFPDLRFTVIKPAELQPDGSIAMVLEANGTHTGELFTYATGVEAIAAAGVSVRNDSERVITTFNTEGKILKQVIEALPGGRGFSGPPGFYQQLGGKRSNLAVQVFGMPVSQNVMGPVLLAMDLGVGGLEMCNIMDGEQMKNDFKAMSPFHHIPTLKAGDVALGESMAILRYLAMEHKPEYYPVKDPVTCARVDFAMSSFQNDIYAVGHYKVVYPVMGFAAAPDDQAAANKNLTDTLNTWTKHFLRGKFVCGDQVTIADFYVLPFLFAQMQPGVHKQTGWKPNHRVMQYVEELCGILPVTSMLKEAGGYSIAEYIASKVPDAGPAPEYTSVPYQTFVPPEPRGKDIKVYGMPASQNCMGAIMLAMDANVGGMVLCDITQGAHLLTDFLAMNPFKHIPVVDDGDVEFGESSAILRYLALKYKPEYYPSADPAACAKVDFAMDSFANEVYPTHVDIVYPVMGFASAPKDQEAANNKYTEVLDTWTTHFLKGKFVLGDQISIADFKAVPFIFAAMQPGVKKKMDVTPSARAVQYVEDFCAAVDASKMLKEAGGYSIAEYIKSQSPT
jgi:glutathione S-transferase